VGSVSDWAGGVSQCLKAQGLRLRRAYPSVGNSGISLNQLVINVNDDVRCLIFTHQ
jgi:hypothetical protein